MIRPEEIKMSAEETGKWGMVINQDKKANASYYGNHLTAEKILYSDSIKLSQESARLVSTLKKLSNSVR